jgi:hypothetical protein
MKSLKRKTEDTFFKYISELVVEWGIDIPVYAGKRYREDNIPQDPEDEEAYDNMVRPALVIECSSVSPCAEIYDPSLGDAVVQIILLRDVRGGESETLDGLLGRIWRALYSDSTDALTVMNDDVTYPFHGSYIVNFISPNSEATEIPEEDDIDILQVTAACQHFLPDDSSN